MPYEYREDISIADVAFEVEEDTLEELFASSAKATENTMVHDLSKIESKIEKEIIVEADDEEKLLHNFLEELIFYKDAENLIFKDFEVKITKDKKFKAEIKAIGEKIDQNKHEMLVEVKSITWHRFSVEEENGKWRATVILDV